MGGRLDASIESGGTNSSCYGLPSYPEPEHTVIDKRDHHARWLAWTETMPAPKFAVSDEHIPGG